VGLGGYYNVKNLIFYKSFTYLEKFHQNCKGLIFKIMSNRILQGIDTIILRVKNVKQSKEWYTEKLGFNNVHEDEKLRLVVMDTFSPTSITLWETSEEIKVNPSVAAYPIFRTQDAGKAHTALKKKGVEVGEIITDHVVTYFQFRDPDGNLLEVCQVH
jgi:catechol 2,3-dioxygenase-like lactoylglutathione lyase family enzyme